MERRWQTKPLQEDQSTGMGKGENKIKALAPDAG
jgi:hypothetical protein